MLSVLYVDHLGHLMLTPDDVVTGLTKSGPDIVVVVLHLPY